MSEVRIQGYPENAELQFARNNQTGTVHVLPYQPVQEHAVPEAIAELLNSSEMFALPAVRALRMLCGTRLFVGISGTDPAVQVEAFADEDTCHACVRALGDQSPRAFEHPVPGPGEVAW